VQAHTNRLLSVTNFSTYYSASQRYRENDNTKRGKCQVPILLYRAKELKRGAAYQKGAKEKRLGFATEPQFLFIRLAGNEANDLNKDHKEREENSAAEGHCSGINAAENSDEAHKASESGNNANDRENLFRREECNECANKSDEGINCNVILAFDFSYIRTIALSALFNFIIFIHFKPPKNSVFGFAVTVLYHTVSYLSTYFFKFRKIFYFPLYKSEKPCYNNSTIRKPRGELQWITSAE
jgi:hypothetical protein